MIKKVLLYFETIKFLKNVQILYRFFYLVRNKCRKFYKVSYPRLNHKINKEMILVSSIQTALSYHDNKFVFLNKEKQFNQNIDWNFEGYGKLWLYNLNYFDFLQQEKMTESEGVKLIYDFIDQSANIKDGMMPFPISLRGINWIKFLTYYDIDDQKINNSLYTQYFQLLDNLEYHILGNHLLENGFSLLFGAYYFNDNVLHAKAVKILSEELDEQILDDGAHFELSPMYHQIMLFRVLDCINLLQNNLHENDKEFLKKMREKASLMLGWLDRITFKDGSIPYLNDSTQEIAPTSRELFEYAKKLNIKKDIIPLNESGYRKFVTDKYECVIDVGNIGPDYIPGHTHADTFNFVLHVGNNPFIVDTGLSTYETNERRMLERSTSSHNTVEVDAQNQSEVWGGFRVAKRAKITHLTEENNSVEATHDGYQKIGAFHTRKFKFEENSIIIEDSIESKKQHQCISYLHFHPKVNVILGNDTITYDGIRINFYGNENIQKEDYMYTEGFNKLKKAEKMKIYFTKKLKMEIHI